MRLRKTVSFLLVCLMISLLITPAYAAASTIKLVDMHIDNSDNIKIEEEITDSYGTKYSNNIMRFDVREEGNVTYYLKGMYGSFKGTVVASTATSSNAEMDLAIFGDGKLLLDVSKHTRRDAPIDFELDMTGVNVLQIYTNIVKSDYDSYIYLVNSLFTKADKPSDYVTYDTLEDRALIDSQNMVRINGMARDVYGGPRHEYIRLTGDAYALWNLNGEYEKFTCSLFTCKATGSDCTIDFTIYLDDKAVYTQSGIKKQFSPENISLDVSGVKVLKITASYKGGWSSDAKVYVGNDMLLKHQHTVGEWKINKNATCTEAGEKVQICTVCGDVAKSEVIAATGHTASGKWEITTKATCTVDGEQVQVCTVCGEPAEKEAIPASGHTASGKWEVSSEPTCTAEGEEVQYCTVCSEIAESRSIAKLEHTPSEDWEITREATCSKEGIQVKKCTVCSGVVAEEPIPTVEHEYGKWTKLSGSAWNPPVVKERTCSVCNDVEHVEDNNTSWLKPLVIVIFIIAIGGVAVICVTLRMNGLPLDIASVKQLFSKETLSDTDIDDILNKPDAPTGKSSDQTEQ